MNLAEIIYQHSLNLPETPAREAPDFIEGLMNYLLDTNVAIASIKQILRY